MRGDLLCVVNNLTKAHSHAKHRERPRPRSLVTPGKSVPHAAPKTHHSLPTERVQASDSDSYSEDRFTPRSPPPPWHPPVLEQSTPDVHALVTPTRGEDMPLEAEFFEDAQVTLGSSKSRSEFVSVSTISSDSREKVGVNEHGGMPAAELGFLPPEEDWNREAVATLGDEPDPTHIGTGQETDIGLQDLDFARLLRKVRKRTDDVLLRRTEWRNEYDQLQHRLRFLNNSTVNMVAALPIPFPDVLRSLSDESSMNQSEILGKFSSGDTPLDEISPSDSNTDLSRKSSKEQENRRERSSITEADTRTSENHNIAALAQQYHDDYKAVKEQAAKTTGLGDELSNLEYRLESEMKAVQERMYAQDFVTELKSEAMHAPLAPSERISHQSSEAVLPPLVAQYFDMNGDVGIYQERLQECDFNHAEGETERAFLRERGDQVEPSDEEFNHNYRTRRKEIEEDLRTAQEEVDILKQRCLDKGHHPDEWRTSRHSIHPPSIQQSGYAAPEDSAAIPMIREISLGILEAPAQVERHSTQRIDTWLRTVEPEPSDQPPDIELEAIMTDASHPLSLAAYELRCFDINAFCSSSRFLEDQFHSHRQKKSAIAMDFAVP